MEFNWGDYYEYDETSPTCLRFKVSRGNKKAGAVAGRCVTEERYYRLGSKNGETLIHRIIWIISMGKIPEGFMIDHIDGDSFNNKLENLRCVTMKVNKRNQRKQVNNKSGVNGVYFEGGDNPRWKCEWIGLDGKRRTFSRSVAKYGSDNAFNLVCECRLSNIKLQNELGDTYSDRHGL